MLDRGALAESGKLGRPGGSLIGSTPEHSSPPEAPVSKFVCMKNKREGKGTIGLAGWLASWLGSGETWCAGLSMDLNGIGGKGRMSSIMEPGMHRVLPRCLNDCCKPSQTFGTFTQAVRSALPRCMCRVVFFFACITRITRNRSWRRGFKSEAARQPGQSDSRPTKGLDLGFRSLTAPSDTASLQPKRILRKTKPLDRHGTHESSREVFCLVTWSPSSL